MTNTCRRRCTDCSYEASREFRANHRSARGEWCCAARAAKYVRPQARLKARSRSADPHPYPNPISTSQFLLRPKAHSARQFSPNGRLSVTECRSSTPPKGALGGPTQASSHLAYSALVTSGDCWKPFERTPADVAGQCSEFASGHLFFGARPVAMSLRVWRRSTTRATEHQTGSSLQRPAATSSVSG